MTSAFSIKEASFSQQREEKVARIRMRNIPSTGILFPVGDESGKAGCLNRIAGIVHDHEIFRTCFFFEEDRLKQAVFKEGAPLLCEDLFFDASEEWEQWCNNVPGFSYLDYPLFKLYWVTVKHMAGPFMVMVCCRLLVDHSGAEALLTEIERPGPKNSAEQLAEFPNFWTSVLAPPLPARRLPFDRLDKTNSQHNAAVGLSLSPQMMQELKQFMDQQGGSLECFFLAVFFVVLSRFSGERDFCIHFHHFGNVLPFRRIVIGAESFLQFYRGLTLFHKNVIKNEMPYDHIMQAAGIDDPDLTLYSLYGFAFREAVLDSCGTTGQHDIMLTVIKKAGSTSLSLEYNPAWYAETTAGLLLENIRAGIETVLRSPREPIHSLNTVPAREPVQMKLPNKRQTLPIIIKRLSQEVPSRLAVICGGEQLTYGELNKRVEAWVPEKEIGLQHELDNLVYRLANATEKSDVTHGRFVQQLYAMAKAMDLPEGCTTLQDLPLTSHKGMVQCLATLIKGGTAIIYNDQELLEQNELDLAVINSNTAHLFINKARQRLSLKKILLYGEAWGSGLIRSLIDAFPGVIIMKTTAIKEQAEDLLFYTIPEHFDPFSKIPAGKPFDHWQVMVTDEKLNHLPPGAIGELSITGPENQTWQPGILARWTNTQTLDLIGYKAERITIARKQLYRGEIEFFINSHPLIDQAAVVLDKEITVFYKSVPNLVLRKEDICSFLLETTSIDFTSERMIGVDEIPLDTAGMIDIETLMKRVTPKVVELLLPQDETQRQILKIWKEVIGIEHDIDIRENFFSAGGNSLKALMVISALYEVFNIQLDLKTVYDTWTIEKLAAIVTQDQSLPPNGPVMIEAGEKNSEGLYPASHSQARLWAVSQASAASAAYNIQQVFELNGAVDLSILKTAMAQLIARYEILRTAFVFENNRLQQKVLPSLDVDKVFFESIIEEGTPHLATTHFDLAHGPVFNVKCIHVKRSGKKYLVFTIHHIIADFWSLTILFDLLRNAYTGLQKELTYKMEMPAFQYRDFAKWQQQMLDEKRDYFIDYWKKQLHAVPAGAGLPLDRARPLQRSYNGKTMNLRLDQDVVAQLSKLSRNEGANLLMTMFAVFNIALFKHTAQKKNIVMVHLAGRDNESFKKQIGLFVNTLPLLTTIDPMAGFNQTLSAVKEAFLEAYNSQHYPFDLLVSDLHIKWDAGQLPLSGIGFNWVYNSSTGVNGQADLGVLMPQPESGTAKFDLLLTGIEQEKVLELAIEYNTDIYDPGTIQLFLEDLRLVCTRLQQPNIALHTLLQESEDQVTTFSF